MIDWVPVIFVTFKVLIFGACMFFAIKWHYDQGRKGKVEERRAVLRAGGKAVATQAPPKCSRPGPAPAANAAAMGSCKPSGRAAASGSGKHDRWPAGDRDRVSARMAVAVFMHKCARQASYI